MSVLSIDFETRSAVDLKATGVYPYAADASTDVWCFAYAFDAEPAALVIFDLPEIGSGVASPAVLPERILDHIAAGGELRAWNAQFERIIWREVLHARYGVPVCPTREQWTCTMAEAAAMALPQSLDQCAKALGVAHQKDKKGYDVMLRMARPRSIRTDGRPVWWADAARRETLYAYCQQDVAVERDIVRSLRRLDADERATYLLDQTINDRGVRIDRPLVRAAQRIVATGTEQADAVIAELTGGEVTAISNSGRLTAWLRAQGLDIPGVAKPAVRDALAGDDLPAAARQALLLRADAGRSSTAKLGRMLESACDDDRVRGMLRYYGASTGRWSGKLVQPQNFPRGEVDDIDGLLGAIATGDYALVDQFAPPIVAVLSALRAMLCAAPGHRFLAGDFSAIEARVLNWLAGQDDVLAHFAAYDAGDKLRDPYVQNAATLYGIPAEDVQKFPHRQTGKFQELGCGYGMGAAKAVSAAKDVYGLVLTPEDAERVVKGYRATHAKVTQFWYETDRACREAIETPGVPVRFGGRRNLKAIKLGSWLFLVLPSGRPLCYAAPRVIEAEAPWSVTARREAMARVAAGEEEGVVVPEPEYKAQIEISGVDPKSKQWGRLRLYGGLLVENITQAVSRDLMRDAMHRLEAAGYPVVLTVHDEVVCEVPNTVGTLEEFTALLAATPAWASDCPVAVECWAGERYRK